MKEIIEKPHWTAAGKEASGTFIPDLITIMEIGKNWYFIIFDAKYYTPVLNKDKEVKGQPGIESVAKQYLYQLAYQDFIEKHGFKVKNCFLMPMKEKGKVSGGTVYMDMLRQEGKLDLQDIKVRFLNTEKAYAYYIAGKKFDDEDIGELEL